MIDVTFGSVRAQKPFAALREYMEHKYGTDSTVQLNPVSNVGEVSE